MLTETAPVHRALTTQLIGFHHVPDTTDAQWHRHSSAFTDCASTPCSHSSACRLPSRSWHNRCTVTNTSVYQVFYQEVTKYRFKLPQVQISSNGKDRPIIIGQALGAGADLSSGQSASRSYQACSYLSSRKSLPPLGQHQIIPPGVRGTKL